MEHILNRREAKRLWDKGEDRIEYLDQYGSVERAMEVVNTKRYKDRKLSIFISSTITK